MLFTEIIAAYCENHTRQIYILWARCWASSVKPGSAHTNHLVSRHRPNHESIWGCSGIAPLILNLGTCWMWVVKSKTRPLHHRRKNASTHRTGWPQRRSRRFEKDKNLLALSEIETRVFKPKRNQYTDYDIPAPSVCNANYNLCNGWDSVRGHRKMHCCFTVPECQNTLWIPGLWYRMEGIHTYIIHTYIHHTYVHTHARAPIHGVPG